MDKKWLRDLEDHDSSLFNRSQLKFLKVANSIIISKVENSFQVFENDDDESYVFIQQVCELKDNFSSVVKQLKHGKSARKSFTDHYPKWKKINDDTIQQLKNITESIKSDKFNCNVAKLVGYVVSFCGGAVLLTSAVLIPASGGLATPLAYAGASMTAAGSSTAFGTAVAEISRLKNNVEKVQDLLTKDAKHYDKMCEWLTRAPELQTVVGDIFSMDVVKGVSKKVKKIVDDGLDIQDDHQRREFLRRRVDGLFEHYRRNNQVEIPWPVIGALIAIVMAIYLIFKNSENRLLFSCASLALKSALGIALFLDASMDCLGLSNSFKSSGAGAKTLAKAVTRGAVAVVSMSLDVIGIALTSSDIHRGSVSIEAEKIAEACEEMEEEAKMLDEVYQRLT